MPRPGDIHFFQIDLGVLVGSVGLLILWLLLSLLATRTASAT